MNIFPWQKQKALFTAEEQELLMGAIQKAEQRTSGEVRLFVESHCRFVNPVDRAQELFLSLKMENTADRNATLVYLALKDRQVAIIGDEGIHQKVGQAWWNDEVQKMLRHFREQHIVEGLCLCINDIGEALHQHFPYDRDTDKNELPDEIVFGR